MRQVIVAGNWKMNKTSQQVIDFVNKMNAEWKKCKVIICPSHSLLSTLYQTGKNKGICIGAQNIYYESKGAFTGETSSDQVKEFAEYVIIGHSERRRIFGEDDSILNKKVLSALNSGLRPIFCVGESSQQRKTHKEYEIIKEQLDNGLRSLSTDDIKKIIIAYEPVWAIGTGEVATPQIAQEMHFFIRNHIKNIDGDIADNIPIIYGGSVKVDNFYDILRCDDVDGALIGGASLDALNFSDLIKIGEKHNIDLINMSDSS
ncbi:triose-phosphate isomerase [Candidatus Woesearchaeota archaeon]|nr:triose-phosphate isomerase [Candidatus Woesearchaeota archaeon]